MNNFQGKNSVLLIHGNVSIYGGAEMHCVRVAETLANAGYYVTIIHAGGFLDPADIFSWSGVRLKTSHVRFISPPIFQSFPKLFHQFILLQYAIVLRYTRSIINAYNLAIGTYGEVPIFSNNLIQSTHVPLFFYDRQSLSYLGFSLKRGLISRWTRIGYVLLVRFLASWSPDAVTYSPILANSNWTANQFLRHYPNCNIKTLYHGASTIMNSDSKSYCHHFERVNSFVILGRVVQGKRVDLAINIIDQLRLKGHELELHIIGNGSGSYAEKIQQLINVRPHITWHKGLSRASLENLAVKQKWAIHCAEHEHYGLSSIELQRLGCVTFVHDSGGQAEVVSNKNLKFKDIDDAIEKIESVISNNLLATTLFSSLTETVSLHEIERYKRLFMEYLEGFFNLDLNNEKGETEMKFESCSND